MAENIKKHSHQGHRERVRNRFETKGITAFEDHEALEMLLFYAIPQRDTNQLAHNLIEEFGSLAGVFDAPISALENVKGIGYNAAVLIKLMPEIYTKYLASKARITESVLDTVDKVGKFCIAQLSGYDHEVVLVACLDNKLRVKKHFIISEGDTDNALIDMKKIVGCVVNTNATSIIIAHNHPAGVAAPSGKDVETMRTISNTLHKLNIRFTDSIVVSGKDYYSMATKGRYTYLFD